MKASRRNLLLATGAVLAGLLLAKGVPVAGGFERDGLLRVLTLLWPEGAQQRAISAVAPSDTAQRGRPLAGDALPSERPTPAAHTRGRAEAGRLGEGGEHEPRRGESSAPMAVVLSESGEPLPESTVQILDHEQRVTWERPVDARGELTLAERGAWVRASAPGYAGSEMHAYPRERVELRLQPGGAIAGRVTDVWGAPLPGVRVVIARSITQTDSGGRFSLEDVLPGRRRLWLSAPGRYQTPPDGQLVLVVPGELTWVTATLRSGGGVRGRVLDVRGTPQAGVRLVVAGVLTRIGLTGPEGAFHIDGLPPGEHRIEVDRGGEVLARATFTIASEHEEVHLELRVVPGVGLRGRVLDSNGAPVEGARVRAVRVENAGLALSQATVGPLVYTDTTGQFEIAGLPPGTYRAEASPATSGEAPFFPSPVGEPDQALEVELPLLRTIRGRVSDPAGLALVAQVEAASADTRVRTRTNSRGEFTLILPDTPATLRVSAAGYTPSTVEAYDGVVVALRPAAALLVDVRDPSGRAYAAPGVEVISQIPLPPRTRLAGPGLVRVFPLPPGRHTLRVHAGEALAPVEVTAVASSEGTSTVRVILERALGVVLGRVEDTAGAPIAGASVSSAQQQTTSDLAGAFRLEGVPPTGTRVAIRSPGHAPYLRRLFPGRTTVMLGAAVPFGGTALRADGSPAANLELVLVDVSVSGDPRVLSRTRTRSDGRFGFLNIWTDTPALAWRLPEDDMGHLLALSLPAPSALLLRVDDSSTLLRR